MKNKTRNQAENSRAFIKKVSMFGLTARLIPVLPKVQLKAKMFKDSGELLAEIRG